MEMMVLIVVLAILLVGMMLPRQYTQDSPPDRAEDHYLNYLEWRYAQERERRNATDNSGCLGLLVAALVAAALLVPLLAVP